MAFDALEFHREAVSTPSHEDVTAMREYLIDTLESAGHDPRVDEAGNVLAVRGAIDDGDASEDGDAIDNGDVSEDADAPHLVLNTHIDTVPPHVPYERDGSIVRGRGACDAKGPLAALVDAFLSAEFNDANGKLTLAITPNEETTQAGAAFLKDRLDADGIIVGEPTGLDVCTAARGQFEGQVTVTGSAAHAATPEKGKNAIRAAAPILAAMDTFDEAAGTPSHELLGDPTLTATIIEGGEAHNQVPAECRITFDRRSVPPEESEDVPPALEDHLRNALPEGFEIAVSLLPRETPLLEAFATDEDEAVVQALADASGGEVRPFGAATEASFFAEVAPTVVFGPGVLADDEGAVAHSEREYVDVDEIEAAGEAVRTTVERLL